uniref:Uncharacterized protein n=1 Tax=Manihot esculenta TaxID=3983 RepID=A0A2C9UW01_MANES
MTLIRDFNKQNKQIKIGFLVGDDINFIYNCRNRLQNTVLASINRSNAKESMGLKSSP